MHIFYCIDIDECVEEVEDVLCDDNAMCIDTEGSYNCSCDSGYTGDGFTCSGLSTKNLLSLCLTLYTCMYVHTVCT